MNHSGFNKKQKTIVRVIVATQE